MTDRTPRGEAFNIMFDRPPNSARGAPKTPRGGQDTVLRKGNSFKFLKKDEGKKASDHNTDGPANTSGGANSSLQWTDSSRALRSAIATDMRREHKDPFTESMVAVPIKPPPQQAPAKAPASAKPAPKQRAEWNSEPPIATRKPAPVDKLSTKGSQPSTPTYMDEESYDSEPNEDDQKEHYRQEKYGAKSAFMKTVKPSKAAPQQQRYAGEDESSDVEDEEEPLEDTQGYGVGTGHRSSSFSGSAKVKFSPSEATQRPQVRNQQPSAVNTSSSRDAARNFFGNRNSTSGSNTSARHNTKALDEYEDGEDYYAQQRRQRAQASRQEEGVYDDEEVESAQFGKYNNNGPQKASSAPNLANKRPTPRDAKQTRSYRDEEDEEDLYDSRQSARGPSRPSATTANRSKVLEEEANLMASLEEERQQCEEAKKEYLRLQQGLEKEKSRLAKQRADEEHRLQRDRDELDTIIEEEKTQCKKDLKAAEERIKSLRSTLQGEKELCKRLREENEALRGQLDRSATQQRDHERIHKGELDRLKIEIASLTGRNQELMDMAKSSQTALLQKNHRDQKVSSQPATNASPQSRMIAAAAAVSRGPPARITNKVDEGRRLHDYQDEDDVDEEEYPEDTEADAYEEGPYRQGSKRNGSPDVDEEDTGYEATGQSGDDYDRPTSKAKVNGKYGTSPDEERRKRELRERRAKDVEERLAREERDREERRKLFAKQKADKLKEDEARKAKEEEEERKRQARLKAEKDEERRKKQEEDARKVAAAVNRTNTVNASVTATTPRGGAAPNIASTAPHQASAKPPAGPPTRLPSRVPTVEELVADDEPMPPLEAAGDIIVSQRMTGAEGNKKETLYRSGKREIAYSNGTRKVELPTGHVVLFFTNGDIKQTWPSNKTTYWYEVAQTMHTQLADGKEIFEFHASQQTERHHPDGTKEILYPEGIYKIMWTDGREETLMPN